MFKLGKRKKKRWFYNLFFVIVVMFFISGILVSYTLRMAWTEEIESEIEFKVNSFLSKISRQVDADFQILNTLKSFVQFHIDTASDDLMEGLNESNSSNRFVRMSIIYLDGSVLHTTLFEDVKKVSFVSLDEKLQNSLMQSFNGENAVAEIYYDTDLERKVLVTSVPIVEDDQVIGILAGYDDISVFQKMLNYDTGDDEYAFLIADSGEILLHTNKNESETNTEALYFMQQQWMDETLLREALESKTAYFQMFEYEGNQYCSYFRPSIYNNLHILYFAQVDSAVNTLVNQLSNTTLIYVVVFVVGSLLLVYSTYTTKRNAKIDETNGYYDELTGLLNLHKFKELILEKIETTQCTIVILNIKRFQLINETFGLETADELLRFVASTIQKEMNQGECCCRESSDHFGMMLLDTDQDVIVSRIQKIEQKILDRFCLKKSSYRIQLNAGVCIGEQGDKSIFFKALWVMNKKKNSSSICSFWDETMLNMFLVSNEIEKSMHKALEQKQFQVYLQPKYDIKTLKIIGAEALVRWIKPDGSTFYPDQFIPVFEANGFCVELDLYMLESVCQILRDWLDKGMEVHPISVNQTKLLFYKSDYVKTVLEIVSRYNLSPNLIILEVLEGLAVEKPEVFNRCIGVLRERGFRVSMDDFGSGYSSLSSLNELKVDEIKIDRKFLMNLGDEKNFSVFQKIISLIDSLEVNVVVEGVETQEHIEILKKTNCNYAQGYYLSKPVPLEEYETLLKRDRGE